MDNPYEAPNFNDTPKLNFTPFYYLAHIFVCLLAIAFLLYLDIALEVIMLGLAITWVIQVSCLVFALLDDK